MRFAVSLLTVLGVASIIGTVLKQNEPYTNYTIKFGSFWFETFEKLGLYDVYHSMGFLMILLFLVLSTSLCIYRNGPLMLKEWRTFKTQASEKSLRAFAHQATFALPAQTTPTLEATQQKLLHFLQTKNFKYKIKPLSEDGTLIAAKAGTQQRLGYILTHAAIVIICFGGLLDGNLVFKAQELLGQKRIETRDLPEHQVPVLSRLGTNNPSFRANMTLPEGTSDNVAFVRMRDGYLVQELPFRITLKDFRIEHYATGQPKSFESDLVITDPELKTPLHTTIRVNHPLIYKGVAIYQSDFQDGGTRLNFKVWNLFSSDHQAQPLNGTIFEQGTLGADKDTLRVEYNDFRKFNIINLSADGKGKPHNVGPNITYKLRDMQGQAKEYVTYMQPMQIDGQFYFISGMRETMAENFRYLRIPVDDNLSINGFMHFRATLLDAEKYAEIAQKLLQKTVQDNQDAATKENFQNSIIALLKTFAQGGYNNVAKIIEKNVPKNEREIAATTYIKMINMAAFEAYNISLVARGESALVNNDQIQARVRDSLNAISDMFFYGTPYYLQLENFEHKQASGLQLTKSPGQKWVYLGSALLVLGIFAMMYIRERRIWFTLKNNQVHFAMSSNRKSLDFEQEFSLYCEQLKNLLA